MKELSELSVKGQFFLTKRQLGNQEGHVVEVAGGAPPPPHPSPSPGVNREK